MSDELDTPLRAFESKIRDQFDLDKLPGWSLGKLKNFLEEDQREEIDRRVVGFYTCDPDENLFNRIDLEIYREICTTHDVEDSLAGTPDHRAKWAEKRKLLVEKLKTEVIRDIQFQVRYIDSILEHPILYDINGLGRELIELVEREDSDSVSISGTFCSWWAFCEDFILLCSYWELFGALVYGDAQYDQLLFFLYKTQGVWVGENVSLLETGNYVEFDNELWRIRCSESILWRIKEPFRVRR